MKKEGLSHETYCTNSLISDGIPVGQPNYSGLAGNRFLYRRFRTNASTAARMQISISGQNVNFLEEIEPFVGNGIKMSLVIPGSDPAKNIWRDMISSAGANILEGSADRSAPNARWQSAFAGREKL